MALLFADENVPFQLVHILRGLGHDVLTALQAGRANRGIPDPDVLAYAVSVSRAVLTNNRRHFHRLHRQVPKHAGIITFTEDPDTNSLAQRIHKAVSAVQSLTGVLIRIIRPP
jgi:predicted nuclease of predicted toxin-antitoxin system